MMVQLISRIFAARNLAHVQHWKTQSYAQHQALAGFYDEVIELLDTLVEAYQGAAGLIEDVPPSDEKRKPADILEALRDDVVWIKKNCSTCCKNISALENIVDEIVALYLSTIYKLENLR